MAAPPPPCAGAVFIMVVPTMIVSMVMAAGIMSDTPPMIMITVARSRPGRAARLGLSGLLALLSV